MIFTPCLSHGCVLGGCKPWVVDKCSVRRRASGSLVGMGKGCLGVMCPFKHNFYNLFFTSKFANIFFL